MTLPPTAWNVAGVVLDDLRINWDDPEEGAPSRLAEATVEA